jgi:hypothetical protein
MTEIVDRTASTELAERGYCPRCLCTFELTESGLLPSHFGCIDQPQPPYQEPIGACVECGQQVQHRLTTGGALATERHRRCFGATIPPAR